MSDPILPFAVWQSGTNQNSIPANDNALRSEILNGLVISESTDAQPGSPARGAIYIMTGAASGTQWATFDEFDLAIYDGAGTWHAYAPVEGVVVNVAGTLKRWNGSAYVAVSTGGVPAGGTAGQVLRKIDGTDYNTEWATPAAGGGSTQGKQAIYVAAAAMRPSVTGGCAALAAAATSANQPDLLTLDFDPATDEFAQFGLVMPKKWNAGTMTARFHWTHGSTTTNFAVVWGIQAVAVSNDDAIGAAYGTAVTVTDTGGTTRDLYTSDETSAMTAAGTPAKEDMVYFRVYRDADAGGDTLAVDAKLIGVTLYVTTNADTDA